MSAVPRLDLADDEHPMAAYSALLIARSREAIDENRRIGARTVRAVSVLRRALDRADSLAQAAASGKAPIEPELAEDAPG